MTHDESFEVKVVGIRRYQTFDVMLEKEPYNHIVPEASSQAEVLSLLKRIYPPEKERLGVVVLEFARNGK